MHQFLSEYVFNFLGYIYLGVELLGHLVTLSFSEELPKLFSKNAAPFYIPTSNKWRLQFHQVLSNTYFQFLKSYPSDCKVLSPYESDLHFPNNFEHLFI